MNDLLLTALILAALIAALTEGILIGFVLASITATSTRGGKPKPTHQQQPTKPALSLVQQIDQCEW